MRGQTSTQLANLRPAWRKRQSGNPNGKPKGAVSLKTRLTEAMDEQAVSAIVAAMIREAKKGNIGMIKLLWDRMEGTAPLKTEVMYGANIELTEAEKKKIEMLFRDIGTPAGVYSERIHGDTRKTRTRAFGC